MYSATIDGKDPDYERKSELAAHLAENDLLIKKTRQKLCRMLERSSSRLERLLDTIEDAVLLNTIKLIFQASGMMTPKIEVDPNQLGVVFLPAEVGEED